MYADRAEIHDYLKTCAECHGLLSHVRLKTVMVDAVWDEDAGLWHVGVSSDETNSRIDAQFLVSAMGGLDVPKYPSLIPGIEKFQGPSFHSSRWDPSVKLDGKAVAVIGTGASAIQIVPAIAPLTRKLYVFQRTPAWILPKYDVQIGRVWKNLFRRLPVVLWLFSCVLFWVHEFVVLPFLGVRFMRRLGEKAARKHMEKTIKDGKLRAALMPKYELGCKRVLLSSTYYGAIVRSNVELVTEGIKEVRESSIICGEASSKCEAVEKEVDVIVYATGFRVLDRSAVRVVGKGGLELKEAGWDTLLGITKHGFPNFFMLLGPNSAIGHTSEILMIEAQVRYTIGCMNLLLKKKRPAHIRRMEVRLSSQQRFQKLLQDRFPSTVWNSGGCFSWYRDATTGHNYTIWPGSTLEYRYRASSPSPSDYHFR